MHLITVNDYLARRDSEWMGQIHRWPSLTVGLVVPGFALLRKIYAIEEGFLPPDPRVVRFVTRDPRDEAVAEIQIHGVAP